MYCSNVQKKKASLKVYIFRGEKELVISFFQKRLFLKRKSFPDRVYCSCSCYRCSCYECFCCYSCCYYFCYRYYHHYRYYYYCHSIRNARPGAQQTTGWDGGGAAGGGG